MSHPLTNVVVDTAEVLHDVILKALENEDLSTDELREIQRSLHEAHSYINVSVVAVLSKIQENS
jgi:hypothetical protein